MDCTSLLKKLSEDPDFDVKYYSVKTLNNLWEKFHMEGGLGFWGF
jgi:hypothetical protein